MLTGIMAMFEMATSLNSQQIQSRPPQDVYSGTQAQQADRELLHLFSKKERWETLVVNNQPWGGNMLCDQLLCKFNQNASDGCSGLNSYASELFRNSPLQKNNYFPGVQTQSNAENLKDACVLSSGSHRILVVPNADFNSQDPAAEPYRVYSCLTSLNQQQCLFETQN